MPLSRRARARSATQNDVPPEDALRFVRQASYLPALRGAYAAYSLQGASDGLEIAAVLRKKSGFARPASRRKQSARPRQEAPPPASGRAAGILEEIASVTGSVDEGYRPSAFRRKVMTSQFQRWYLGLSTQLREQFAPLSPEGDTAVEQWLAKPFEGAWPFPLSRKGCEVYKTAPGGDEPAQSRRPTPGSSACRRHVLLVFRGVTRLVRRLQISDYRECKWMLRATQNSDEVRYPSDKRRSTCTSARRLVRGPPDVNAPEDFWPGTRVRSRPPGSRPDGEPEAEPATSQKASVVLKKSLSQHAISGEPSDKFHSPPCVRY